MRFVDAFRAQYFITTLEKELCQMERKFSSLEIFSSHFSEAIVPFLEALCIELDQIALPTIAYELRKAKDCGKLRGETAKNRYESFFVKQSRFTREASEISHSYPFLFSLTDHLIVSSCSNLSKCIDRLIEDFSMLIENGLLTSQAGLSSIDALSGSDRHRNRQALLLTFKSGTRLIYKPVDLHPDSLFSTFIELLELSKPYDLKTLRTLPRDGYGWIEFIPHQPCDNEGELAHFFTRAGVLLAIADALNYTDGHCENLIACGSYPVLLDGETFFQNYAMSVTEQKNILSTLLIQKADDHPERTLYSAFQTQTDERLEILHPYAVNDQTDELQVRFRGISPTRNQNNPIFNDKHFSAHQYALRMIDGYSWAYDHLSKKVAQILDYTDWWHAVSQVQSRSVIRETAAYAYLLRRIQQPDLCSTEALATQFIESKLCDSPYIDYEIKDLLQGNIPYFYHSPGKRHFYDGDGFCYENSFEANAVDSIRWQLINRSESAKSFDCQILTKHLRGTSLCV